MKIHALTSEEIENLPPLSTDLCLVALMREFGFISLVFKLRDGSGIAGAFTLHRTESRKLADALVALAESVDGDFTFVEGAYVGGPPSESQVLKPK